MPGSGGDRLSPGRRAAVAWNALWTLAALAAWLAFAWLAAGWWALPLLAAAHGVDGWRVARRERPRRGAPGPRHYGTAAAWVLAAVALATLAGYRPDWLVGGGLALSALLRWRDEPRLPVAAGPGGA